MALDRLTKVDGGGISTTSDYRVGIITATKFVGPIEGDVTGSITATDGAFSGNVTIGGTLTYEDVTNIDSVGLITARNGVVVSTGTATTALVVNGDARVTGILTIGTSSLKLDGSNNLVNVGTALTLGHTQGLQFHTQNLHSAGFEVNQINASGIITATSYRGDGSQLTGITGTTINNNADNRVITGSGTANTLNGEANLTYDGNDLTITGANGNLLNVNHTDGGGAQGVIRTKASQANSSSFIRAEDSGNTYIGLLKYGTGHSAYGALGAGDGAIYANSGGGNDVNITLMADSSTGHINFATGGNTERMKINKDGQLIHKANKASGYIAEFHQDHASNSGQILIDSPTNNDGRPVFIDLSRAGTLQWSIGQGYNHSGGAFHFATSSLGAGITGSKLTITSAGDVGLGTATPQHSSGYATLTCSGSTGGQIAFFSGTRRHFIWGNSSGSLNIGGGYVGGGDVKIFTNGNNERLRIASNGQITTRGASGTSFNNAGNGDFGSFLTINGGHTTNQWGILSLEGNTASNGYPVGQIQFINQDNANGSSGANVQSRMVARIDSIISTSDSNAGDDSGGDLRFFTKQEGVEPTERFRMTSDGYLNFYNDSNTNKGLRWYNNVGGSAKAASIEWGNGNANWQFKHFRNDNQADNPYANIDFFTGDWTNPTRALRITNDGNHIREKHSRFATRISYTTAHEAAHAQILFHTPHVNVGNDFNSSRYTAPVDGSYAFWFFTNVNRTGAGSFYATWKKNGSEVHGSAGGRMYDQHGGSGWVNLSGCLMMDLQEGEYIEVFNGGTSVNYDGNSYGQFMGWLVG